ncbi:MAG: class I SAM-dependent methyltransferase [Pyrinomonadaceae bacterium]
MSNYNPAEYGDSCAAFYDRLYPNIEAGLLDTLVSLAHGGRILELGLATGRVARRLNEVGQDVYGIEASKPMIELCRSLPGGSGIKIVRGDFASLPFTGHFNLVFALVNTLSLLPSRKHLTNCLNEVGRILAPKGIFVYETYIVADSDCAVTNDYPIQTHEGIKNYRVTSLDTPPEIFNKIATDSGLRLLDVWRDWRRNPASTGSARRIMIYEPAI